MSVIVGWGLAFQQNASFDVLDTVVWTLGTAIALALVMLVGRFLFVSPYRMLAEAWRDRDELRLRQASWEGDSRELTSAREELRLLRRKVESSEASRQRLERELSERGSEVVGLRRELDSCTRSAEGAVSYARRTFQDFIAIVVPTVLAELETPLATSRKQGRAGRRPYEPFMTLMGGDRGPRRRRLRDLDAPAAGRVIASSRPLRVHLGLVSVLALSFDGDALRREVLRTLQEANARRRGCLVVVDTPRLTDQVQAALEGVPRVAILAWPGAGLATDPIREAVAGLLEASDWSSEEAEELRRLTTTVRPE